MNETARVGALRIVDPVMADNGKLYAGFNESFPSKIAELCKGADVILPNLTEAAFLLGEPYVGSGYNKESNFPQSCRANLEYTNGYTYT